MKILRVFKAHWNHESDAGYIHPRTVGGDRPHLFTIVEKAKAAADKACREDGTGGGGMEAHKPTSEALALQLEDGRVFPVEEFGEAPTAKPEVIPQNTRWIEGRSIFTVRVVEEKVRLWNGTGRPPRYNDERPTVVIISDELYQLETDKASPLDPE